MSGDNGTSASPLDVAAVRAQFPGLKTEQIYMDNAGGSQALATVISSINTYLSETNVQLGAPYPVAHQSTEKCSAGYTAAARFINATSVDEVVLGSSTTQLFTNLASSLAHNWQRGQEIVLSLLDHEANVAAWVRVAEDRGLVIRWWGERSSATDPVFDLDELEALLNEKTVLVACTHASNITGNISPIRAIADLVHSKSSALLCVDGVAFAPHRRVDVQALGVDIYAFSWYKVYGPHVSQLFVAQKHHGMLRSLAHFFNPSRSISEKLGLAGGSYELVQALPTVQTYLESGATDKDKWAFWTAIEEHEEMLQKILLDCLNAHPAVSVYGDTSGTKEKRVPVISFGVKGISSADVVEKVRGLAPLLGFRNGHMYSYRLCDQVLRLKDVGDGVVRVSLAHYNTVEEVQMLVHALKQVLSSVTS